MRLVHVAVAVLIFTGLDLALNDGAAFWEVNRECGTFVRELIIWR
jgi:hypothetical protein